MPPILTQTDSKPSAIALAPVAGLGVLISFLATVAAFRGIEAAGAGSSLVGANNELGYPSSAFALVVFAIVLAVSAAELSGAALRDGWRLAVVAVLSIGVLFEVWVLYLAVMGPAVTVFHVLELVLMAAALVFAVLAAPRERTDYGLGLFLIVAGVGGFFAAMRLTVDKVGTFIDPATAPSCDLSVLVQCGKNLASWQGSLFGFPNPLLGVGGWIAVIMVGLMVLSGLKFGRGFWLTFNVGVAGALALVCWLIYQSIFSLATLCPWCMATWSVTIPTFWLVTLYNLKSGHIPVPERARAFFRAAYGWVPLLTFTSYVIVFVIAQLRLDVIHHW
ncbi:vitamin K epoxide reductase family protein [Parafrigoribacterium soli]|uniref:vitamin K epoxide reductase family protein n=1 Tax=Parafrigoribacterium soli TaxID=3144663 RepID=UPI0032ED8429